MIATDGVSIVYLTHREALRFEWFADSLARQVQGDEVEVIVVDGLYSPERAEIFATIAGDRFPCRSVAAKPTPYNGVYRRTRCDFFAAASARNTGILYARRGYIVFCDDLSVLMPGWWEEVRAAAALGAVVAGAYQKRWDMHVEDGVLTSSRLNPAGVDSRWPLGDDERWVRISGGQLFGSSFGAPRSLLLDVNGFDELCDSIGGEDWQLGVRLEWARATIYYSRRMLTVESEELHQSLNPLVRLDKKATPSEYISRLQRFGVTRRHVEGPWDSSHMVLDLLYGMRTSQTLGNYYLLSELDATSLPHLEKRFPEAHWFDDQPLSEL